MRGLDSGVPMKSRSHQSTAAVLEKLIQYFSVFPAGEYLLHDRSA
eukprot:COSAG01_NODE_77_length_28297_cov_104.096230_13_plen_45_part_00